MNLKQNVLTVILTAGLALMGAEQVHAVKTLPDHTLDIDFKVISSGMETYEAAVHPKLFASEEQFKLLRHDAIENNGMRKAFAGRLFFLADSLLGTAELERKVTGRRLLSVSDKALYRIGVLALAYRLDPTKTAYRDKCIREMKAVASFSDWNPSHYLDTAEMTLALAMGYDWLYNDLSPEDRTCFANAILDKGIRTIDTKTNWWRQSTSNWTQVCWGSLLGGLLAVSELEPALCRPYIHEAIKSLAIPMANYAPGGNYAEGPGYWAFGTCFNLVGLTLVKQAFGQDFGLSQLPGFRETGFYYDYITGPSGYVYNFSDNSIRRRPFDGFAYWFAQNYNAPEMVCDEEREALLTMWADRTPVNPTRDNGSRMPFKFFWLSDERVESTVRNGLKKFWLPGGAMPIATLRTGWNPKSAVMLALKGNASVAGHKHLDAGAFVYDAHGTRWLCETGLEGYHRIESMGLSLWDTTQMSDRWKLFRLNNLGHNTITIDGHLQNVNAAAEITDAKDGESMSCSVNLSAVYSADCTSAVRTYRLEKDGTAVITDELKGLKPGATVVWQGLTTKTAVCNGRNAVLSDTESGASITLTSADCPWTAVDQTQPKPVFKGDSPNRGLTGLQLARQAPADGTVTFKVSIKP